MYSTGSSPRGWLLLLAFISALGDSQAASLVLDQPTLLEVCATDASQAKEAEDGGGEEDKAGTGGVDQRGGEESPG